MAFLAALSAFGEYAQPVGYALRAYAAPCIPMGEALETTGGME